MPERSSTVPFRGETLNFALVPGKGVESGEAGRFHAHAEHPWLEAPALAGLAGRWIKLRYRSGLFDEAVRPLIRFRGRRDQVLPMNGALMGVGEWIGRVPDDTQAVAINPVRRAGPFSFALDDVVTVPRLDLVLRGLGRAPRLTMMALGARLIGAREEARHCLKFSALGTSIADYHPWLAKRTRAIDPDGFDRHAADWTNGPRLHVVTIAAAPMLQAALDAQSCPRWCLHEVALDTPLSSLGMAPSDLVTHASPDDCLSPHAVAMILEAFAIRPDWNACYGDEDRLESGIPCAPRLKPDWSPLFQENAAYVGDGVVLRTMTLDKIGCTAAADLKETQARLHHLPMGAVGHLRRLVWRRGASLPPTSFKPSCAGNHFPKAAIILPTRDQPDHLKTCLDGLLNCTDYPALELVILDNGTRDGAALALLAEAARDPRVRVLTAPGAFNYAALCNRGAAASDAPLLVFFNNDVAVTDGGWLKAMARRAMDKNAGLVGARLLYPDGCIQHAGVVLGLGEAAQHAYRGATNGQNYLEQLDHGREVSSVTGAVMAVTRDKFAAVGGFDEAAFPVLYNDTDLCLKLAAKGWTTLYEPAASLIHAESASRGFSFRPFTRHAAERQAFLSRWQGAIADDPYFHPALSLYGWIPALA